MVGARFQGIKTSRRTCKDWACWVQNQRIVIQSPVPYQLLANAQ